MVFTFLCLSVAGFGSFVCSLRPKSDNQSKFFPQHIKHSTRQSSISKLKPINDIVELAEDSFVLLDDFVNAFIDFPKPLIAVMNGPAFGITVTTLALCNVVICSNKATFKTPFIAFLLRRMQKVAHFFQLKKVFRHGFYSDFINVTKFSIGQVVSEIKPEILGEKYRIDEIFNMI